MPASQSSICATLFCSIAATGEHVALYLLRLLLHDTNGLYQMETIGCSRFPTRNEAVCVFYMDHRRLPERYIHTISSSRIGPFQKEERGCANTGVVLRAFS
jgi:hypothetical protein